MTAREALSILIGFVEAISPSKESPVWDALDELEKMLESIDTRESQRRDAEYARRS